MILYKSRIIFTSIAYMYMCIDIRHTHLDSMIKPSIATVLLRSVAMENTASPDGLVVVLHGVTSLRWRRLQL